MKAYRKWHQWRENGGSIASRRRYRMREAQREKKPRGCGI